MTWNILHYVRRKKQIPCVWVNVTMAEASGRGVYYDPIDRFINMQTTAHWVRRKKHDTTSTSPDQTTQDETNMKRAVIRNSKLHPTKMHDFFRRPKTIAYFFMRWPVIGGAFGGLFGWPGLERPVVWWRLAPE